MAKGDNGERRARAWVLLNVDDPEVVAKELYRRPDAKVDEPWFLVRVDVVVGGEYNIVIPVDAEDDTALDAAFQYIQGKVELQQWAILKVQVHYPGAPDDPERYPPQRAQGYVTYEEYRQWSDSVVPGLQIQSPGANAWG